MTGHDCITLILTNFDIFFLQITVPLIGTLKKQSLGQIWDKFGVRGVFECDKGKDRERGNRALVIVL